jgi:multidrug efflux system membrane fusion protein
MLRFPSRSPTPPDDPAKPETGFLTFIDSNVDMNTGTIKLKGTFNNSAHRLTPGQFVRVTLGLGKRSQAMLIPNQAVQTGQDGSFVYRVTSAQAVEMVPIKLAGRVDQDMIVDEGLQPGDTVVTEGQLRLAPGMKIRLRDPRPTRGNKGDKGKDDKGGAPAAH